MAEQPEEGTRLTAAQIHENVLRPAEHEIRRSAAALLLSALAAGLVIGFSCLAAAFAASVVPEPYKHAVAAAGYPLGFIFVIMARSELFTENTLVPVVPLLERRDLETLGLVARIWALLLSGIWSAPRSSRWSSPEPISCARSTRRSCCGSAGRRRRADSATSCSPECSRGG